MFANLTVDKLLCSGTTKVKIIFAIGNDVLKLLCLYISLRHKLVLLNTSEIYIDLKIQSAIPCELILGYKCKIQGTFNNLQMNCNSILPCELVCGIVKTELEFACLMKLQ